MVAQRLEIPGPGLQKAAFGFDVIGASPIVAQSSSHDMGRGVQGATCGGYHPSSGRSKRRLSVATVMAVALALPCWEYPAMWGVASSARSSRRASICGSCSQTSSTHCRPLCREGFAVHDLAARGVDDCGTGFHLPEKGGIGHVAGRGVERRVEGEQVGFAGHLPERQEAAVFALLARRVARQHAEAPRLGILPHERSDMAYAYDAERPVGRLPALRAREMDEHGADPLQHTAGIAAGGCGDVDAAGGAPGEVDMVESDGRRGDEPHAGAFEQRGVASRAGADDQGVGVADVGRRNRLAGEVPYLGIRFQNPLPGREWRCRR